VAKKNKSLTISHTAAELMAMDRHTDWTIRQAEGGNLYGRRARGGAGFQGVANTRKGKSKNACRGKVAY
jgi:hypothetical protein